MRSSDDAAVLEQLRQHPVGDGRADLGLDVVADDRDAGVLELLGPHRVGGDEDRQRVDEGDAGVDGALCVELVGILGADREVGDEHVGLGVLEHLRRRRPARRRTRRSSPGSTCRGRRACGRAGTVTPGGGTSQILIVLFSLAVVASARSKPTFLASTSKAATNSTSRDVVVAELHVHQPGHGRCRVGVSVELHALDQRRGAVADADDGYTDRTHAGLLNLVVARRRGPAVRCLGDRCSRWLCAGACRCARVDQLVQPADLALDGLESVALQLQGVGVDAARGAASACDAVEALLEPAAGDPRGCAAGSRRRCGRRTRSARRSCRRPT